jgi:translation initiation factor IF-3
MWTSGSAASHPATDGASWYTEKTAAPCRLSFRDRQEGEIAQELRVNERIRAREVRLVAPDGSQIGVKTIDEARWLASQLGLDLVEVAPDARPPVCRLMDYGKYKYEQSVRDREARKRQSRTVIKEVKFRPKIDSHDYEVKMRRALEFLEDGDKVKVTMMFRGREVTHPEIGQRILSRLSTDIGEAGTVEQGPKLEGRNMTMLLAPVPRSKRRSQGEPEEATETEPGSEGAEVAADAADEE